jgi:hypothetical protein
MAAGAVIPVAAILIGASGGALLARGADPTYRATGQILVLPYDRLSGVYGVQEDDRLRALGTPAARLLRAFPGPLLAAPEQQRLVARMRRSPAGRGILRIDVTDTAAAAPTFDRFRYARRSLLIAVEAGSGPSAARSLRTYAAAYVQARRDRVRRLGLPLRRSLEQQIGATGDSRERRRLERLLAELEVAMAIESGRLELNRGGERLSAESPGKTRIAVLGGLTGLLAWLVVRELGLVPRRGSMRLRRV